MLDFSPVSLKFETGGYSVRKNSSCRRGKNLLFTKMGGGLEIVYLENKKRCNRVWDVNFGVILDLMCK